MRVYNVYACGLIYARTFVSITNFNAKPRKGFSIFSMLSGNVCELTEQPFFNALFRMPREKLTRKLGEKLPTRDCQILASQ